MAEKKSKKKLTTDKISDSKKLMLKRCLLGFLIVMLTGIIVVSGYALAVISKAKSDHPDISKVKNLQELSILLDDAGNTIGELSGEQTRYIVDLDKINPLLQKAVVSIEDERFYDHSGVDFKRLISSTLQSAIAKITNKGTLAGGSTLTQQIVKNNLLTNEISIDRKIKEIYLALKVEDELSKEEILELYLNTIPVGGTIYGVEAGAQYYFSKSAKEINLLQCAYLAGVTQSPAVYNGFSDNALSDNPEFIKRTKNVLAKMKEHNDISEEQYNDAISQINSKGRDAFEFKKKENTDKQKYEWFTRAVMSQVKADYKEQHPGMSNEEVDKKFSAGVTIHTTMNKELQEYTQEVLDNRDNFNISNPEEYDETGMPLLQAAATITDYKTGQVKALVGGRQPKIAGGRNRAYGSNSERPIGSTTKPLTVYAAGIDSKQFTSASAFDDAPLPKEMQEKYKTDDGKLYNPRNENRTHFEGLIDVRQAIKVSSNLVALQAEDQIGLKTGNEYAEKFGINTEGSSASLAALALGQYEKGSNTTNMASAYGVFGNGGKYIEPKLYTKVVDATDQVILEAKPEEREVVSEQTAYIMYDLLKAPIEGSAAPAKWGNIDVVGKTGTTDKNRDIWFAGLTPYYSASVWIGYDKPTTVNTNAGSGGSAGAIFGKIMKKAHEGLSNKALEKPDGIVQKEVCTVSGKLPTSSCKGDPRGTSKIIRKAYFSEDNVPTESCDVHVTLSVTKNNKLPGPNTPEHILTKRVFIKKKNPFKGTDDYSYIAPTEKDNTKYPDDDQLDEDTGNDDDKGKDKNKDKNKENNGITDGSDNNNNNNTDNNNPGNNNNNTGNNTGNNANKPR